METLPVSQPPARPSAALTWPLLALLVAVICLAFAPTFRASFVYLDDQTYVFENPRILGGLSDEGFKYALLTRESGMWIPLTRLSLLMDAEITKNYLAAPPANALPNAVVYHVVNVSLHALGACVLFLLFRRGTGLQWQSFAIALLWAIHPLRVESVAWVTERKDVLSGLFGFLSLYLHVVWREERSAFWYVAALISLELSLMAKATFVTVPFLMLLLDYWPLKRWDSLRTLRMVLLEKVPFFVAGMGHALLAAYVARRISQHDTGHVLNALINYVRYLWMQFEFTRLSPYYPYTAPSAGMVAMAGIGLLLVTALVLAMRRRAPWLVMGWFWYLGAGVPVVGFVYAFTQGYADRFTFLPSVGWIALIVFSVPQGLFQGRRLAVSLPALALIAGILSFQAFRQCQRWQDTRTLFSYARDVTPPNELVHRCLAAAYHREGNLAEAYREMSLARQIEPDSAAVLVSLADLQIERAEFADAVAAINQALPLLHGLGTERELTADAYMIQGRAYAYMGRKSEAIDRFQQVLRLLPNDPRALAAIEWAQSR